MNKFGFGFFGFDPTQSCHFGFLVHDIVVMSKGKGKERKSIYIALF